MEVLLSHIKAQLYVLAHMVQATTLNVIVF